MALMSAKSGCVSMLTSPVVISTQDPLGFLTLLDGENESR